MKKFFLKGSIVALGILPWLSSCSEDSSPYGNFDGPGGRVIPSVSLDANVTSSQRNLQSKAPDSRSEAMSVSLSQLTLTLTPADGSEPFVCTGVDNFPTDRQFKTGNYTFEVSYGDIRQEGFDMPYYYGYEEIKVEEDKATSVSVQAALANSMVTIEFGDNLLQYATDVTAALQTTGDDIVFDTSEARAAYVQPGTTAVKVTLTKPNGTTGTLTAATFTAKARYHHTVKIDLTQGSADALLDVTFDDTVEEEDVEIELSDEILNAPAPTLTLNGFSSGEPVSFIPGLSSAQDLTVDIIAKAKLKSVIMRTSGNALLRNGWLEDIDLLNATADQQATLKSLGLEALGLFRNPDKIAVVDLSGVAQHVSYDDNATNIVEITLTVIDQAAKSSDPVTLVLQAEPLKLDLKAVSSVYPGVGNDIELSMTYNGSNPAEELVFQVNNGRGTWTTVTPTAITPVAGQDNTYKVVIKAPDTEDEVLIRALCAPLNKYSNQTSVKQVPFKLTVDEADVFARRATLKAVVTEGDLDATTVAKTGFKLTPAEGTVSVENGTISLTGLTPGKSYSAVITYDGMTCRTVSFTTEQALQLPDAGFDNWESEKKGDYQYLWTVSDGSVWNSMNPLTTSEYGNGSGSGLSTGGCAYKATSGTIPANGRSTQSSASGGLIGTTKHGDGHTQGDANIHTDKQYSGSNAALIRTVGWGKGNTANPSGGFATCNNVTVGELYLGSYADAPVYGYSFASRPSGLTFYYHYDVLNASTGDQGYAEITVYDAEGKVVATASAALPQADSYQKATVELNYAKGASKASKISVVFKSSNNPDAIQKNTTWFSTPGSNNTSGGEYYSSELYVDEVELTY